MIFIDEKHEKAYKMQIERCNVVEDSQRQALIYCLTLTEGCRANFDDCYNKDTQSIELDCINAPWATSTDKRCIRLGFNLFNDGIPTDESALYTPSNIFCDSQYREYMFEAVKIRFS